MAGKEDNELFNKEHLRNLVKVNDLPFYKTEVKKQETKIENDSKFIKNVSFARKFLINNLTTVKNTYDESRNQFSNLLVKSKTAYEDLIDENQKLNKVILIPSSGLLGLALAFRKGYFKKLLYSSLAVGITTAISYPNQTKDYCYIGAYIVKNKWPPIIKEHTGIDVQDGIDKSFKLLSDLIIFQPFFKGVLPENNQNEHKKKQSDETKF